MNAPTAREILEKFDRAYEFKRRIGLYDTVQVNEDFFIGNQWEGVQANGLPTPTFNILKQVVNFQVSTIAASSIALRASPMPGVSCLESGELEKITRILNRQYEAILERNHIVSKLRQFLRNAAVDGDGCMYFYFDPTVRNGQRVAGEIAAEVVENTRVHFGNPNCREVQKQPWILITRRELVEEARRQARENRRLRRTDILDAGAVKADSEKFQNKFDAYTDDKVTVCTYFYKNRDTGTIWCAEATEAGLLRTAYDTGYTLYPLVWLSWDYIQDCYHGQAMLTGLLPNQKFINKMFALVGISLTTTAFPKIVYDKTRIRSWDGSVGTAVGVNGNVEGVARTINASAVNPQIAQFMELAIDKTRSFLGASDVAMGDGRPDNTSAIIALQRAANTPMEMTKQNLYQCVEDMGRIFLDMMAVRYGVRRVEVRAGAEDPAEVMEDFDFSRLRDVPVAIRQDAGASAYWSEIASMQTIDNLLRSGHISLLQYLERVPSGYIVDKQKLIDDLRTGGQPAAEPGQGAELPMELGLDELPVTGGRGFTQLHRKLNEMGVS